MANLKQKAPKGWTETRLRPNSDALADWVFFTDPLFRAEGARRALPVTVGLRSGDIGGLRRRLEDFRKAVNRKKDRNARIGDLELGIPGETLPRIGVNGVNHPDRYYTVISNDQLYRLLAEPDDGGEPEHPARDIFFKVHGPGLPEDALGREAPLPPVDLGDAKPRPCTVVTAVIDTGMPLFADRFRKADGTTRVEYAWIQDGKHQPGAHVAYGREFTAGDIDLILQQNGANGPLLNQDAAYADAGLADFTQDDRHIMAFRMSHGAHVADIAAGIDPADDRGQNPVIFVQLPNYATEDTSGGSLGPHVVSALDYIADRADRIAADLGSGRLPLVINLSFGYLGGPLDGTGYLDRTFDDFIAARTATGAATAIVLPAGNRYLSQCHVKLTPEDDFHGPGRTETLRWRVQPDDHTASTLELWMPESAGPPPASRLSLRLTPPGGGFTSPPVPEIDGLAWEWKPGGTDVVAKISYQFIGAPTNRGKFTIILQATARLGPGPDLAPSGRWLVEAEDTGLSPGDQVHAWIQRDDALPRYGSLARQSRFTDPAYERFTAQGYPNQQDTGPSPIKREGTQNAMAAGNLATVIGGIRRKDGQPAQYSAGGDTLNPARPGPNAMAESDTSYVHGGVLAAGTRDGSMVAQNGTSVAAPRITRAIAQWMATGQPFNNATVAAWAATDEAGVFASLPPQPTPQRGGAGRIDRPGPPHPPRIWMD